MEVRQAYKNLSSFTRIASGWSVPNLCQMPHFTLEDVHKYLLNSPDKEFDGESLRAYKQLRSYQLFDERHIHDIEINLWEKGSHLFSSVQSVGHRRTRAKMPENVLFALIGKSRAAMALTTDSCPV